MSSGHGDTAGVAVAAWLEADPDLAMVTANMAEWAAAHPCDCEALCVCDDGNREPRGA